MPGFELDLEVDGLGAVQQEFQRLEEAWSDPPVIAVGTNAEYAVHLEFGRGPVEAQTAEALRFEDEDGNVIYRASVSGHPPYPFLRPAVREMRANPRRFVRKNTDTSLEAAQSANDLVWFLGSALETQMKKNVTARGTGRSPGTHPDHPKVRSGNLRADIRAIPVS